LEWTVECLGGGCLATLVDGYISQVMTRKRTWCMNVMNGTPLQVIPILKTNLLSKLLTSRWWIISYVDIMNLCIELLILNSEFILFLIVCIGSVCCTVWHYFYVLVRRFSFVVRGVKTSAEIHVC
jgi:hypothetical protein